MIEPAASATSRPAATLIVLRDGPPMAPEILMVQRAATMAFAAGALVFPGGALDEDDYRLAETFADGLPVDEAAARIGAIRETLEESGIAPGLNVRDPGLLAEMRTALASGMLFSELIRSHDLLLKIGMLTPFSRWHPNPAEKLRHVFDTRFFLARYDWDGPEPTVDNTEHVDLFWASARDTLARCEAGGGRIIFPTRRNLERLAQFDSITDLESHAQATTVEKVVPWIEDRPEGRFLCIPNHLGYPVCEERIDTASRG
tara:strand:+ start:678 stop:1454 length:777 start_codon:yes stop_codon:yes gene_type:complete